MHGETLKFGKARNICYVLTTLLNEVVHV